MWSHAENGEAVRPLPVDSASSRSYVYIRKNIMPVEATEDRPAHYEWDELKVPRENWEVFRQVLAHGEALEDVYAALVELAELVVGV